MFFPCSRYSCVSPHEGLYFIYHNANLGQPLFVMTVRINRNRHFNRENNVKKLKFALFLNNRNNFEQLFTSPTHVERNNPNPE